MIDNFSGIDTDGGGEGGHYGFCHRRHAVMILFFLKDRSSLQYFIITQGMGQRLCSLPYALHVILGEGLGLWVGWGKGEEEFQGSIPVYYEAFFKT